MTSADRGSVELGLDQLVDAELVFERGAPPNFSYTFKHAMLQDTAYESLLRSARRALHGRIGAALRDQFPERCEAEPEVTACHFDLAGDGDEAILFYERAGTQAISRTANAEAIGHLERAVALFSDQVETSIGSPSSSGFSSPLQA